MCARLIEIYPSSASSLGWPCLGHFLLHAHGLLHEIVSLFLATFRLRDVGEVRVDVDEEAIRVAWLEQLGRGLVELPCAAPIAQVLEDACQDGVAPRRVLRMRVGDEAGDLHCERGRLLAARE